MLFYRTGIDGFGTPESWSDCSGPSAKAAMGRARMSPANAGVAGNLRAASAAQLADEEVRTVFALETIWAFGGEVIDRDGLPVLSSDSKEVVFDDRAKEALAQLARAYKDRDLTLPNADIADEDAAVAAFKDGQALCMRNWPISYDKIGSVADEDRIAFGVEKLPYPSALGGQDLAISRSTDKPRAAQELIEFLTSQASQLILFEVGGFAPARKSVYDVRAGAARPYVDELRRGLVDARPRPVTPCYVTFSQKFREGIMYALQHDGSLDARFPSELASTLTCIEHGLSR